MIPVNNKTNLTTTVDPCVIYSESTFTQAFKTIVYLLIFCVSIIGNSTVVYVVYRNLQERNMTNWFIANLAASDIIITLTGMPNMITELYVNQWIFGTFVCKMVVYLQSVAVALSVLTLVAVTCDRYLCVVSPLRRRPGVDKAGYIVASIWVIALSVMAPLISVQKVKEFGGTKLCIEEWSDPFDKYQSPKHYTVILFVVMYVVPLIGMAALYLAICRILWRRKPPGEQIITTEALVQKSRRRVFLMLVTVTFVFAACWLPLWIFQFIIFFGNIKETLPCQRDIKAFYFVSLFLGHSNSAINPFLYSFFNKSFRNGFKNSLGCLHRCFMCHSNRIAPTSAWVNTAHYTVKGTGRAMLSNDSNNQTAPANP